MENKNKRKEMVYLTIAVLTLVALVAGATYAYFQAQSAKGTNVDLNATTATTDNLTFATSGEITISADATNFTSGEPNKDGKATATATLIPNNKTNTADATYNVYLQLEANTFEYSTYTKEEAEDKTFENKMDKETAKAKGELNGYTGMPELVLTITKNGSSYMEVVTELPKYILKKDATEDSYDITEASGLIKIGEEVPIVATDGTKTDTWEVKITLINLEKNQNLNTGKKLTGKVIIQHEKIKDALDTLKSDIGQTLFYHDGVSTDSGSELEAGDYSYRYSGASTDVHNYVCFGGECSNDPTNENYANLYRIIGMFPTNDEHTTYQMKIIKADATTETETGGTGNGAYYGKYSSSWKSYYKGDQTNYFPKMESYYWNKQQNSSGDNTNDWSKSNLNTENLNKTYLNYIKNKDNEKWYNMIEDHTWITAGNTSTNIYSQNAKNAYNNEITNPAVGTALATAVKTYQARVGLMYVSDYMYAATKDNWTTLASNYSSAASKNWMYMGLNEWTITRLADNSNYAFYVYIAGDVNYYNVADSNTAVRPVLYLKSDVKISTGSGTGDDPYILSM